MNSLASLTSISSQNLDMELMRSQITRTDHLHNEITHRFQNSFTLAQNAVSFVNSKPTKTMQLMALDFTEKLASQVASLHSIDIGLNQGQIHNYLLSTQAIAQQLKDADLIDLTTTQLQQMQPKLG